MSNKKKRKVTKGYNRRGKLNHVPTNDLISQVSTETKTKKYYFTLITRSLLQNIFDDVRWKKQHTLLMVII